MCTSQLQHDGTGLENWPHTKIVLADHSPSTLDHMMPSVNKRQSWCFVEGALFSGECTSSVPVSNATICLVPYSPEHITYARTSKSQKLGIGSCAQPAKWKTCRDKWPAEAAWLLHISYGKVQQPTDVTCEADHIRPTARPSMRLHGLA